MNKPTNEMVVTATSASTAEPFNAEKGTVTEAEKGTVTEYGLQAEEQPKPIFGSLPIGYPTGTATTNNTDDK